MIVPAFASHWLGGNAAPAVRDSGHSVVVCLFQLDLEGEHYSCKIYRMGVFTVFGTHISTAQLGLTQTGR